MAASSFPCEQQHEKGIQNVTKQTEEQKLMHKWWMRVVLAVVFGALAYGFASLAIDSGSIWQYAVAVILLYWSIAHLIRGIRFGLNR